MRAAVSTPPRGKTSDPRAESGLAVCKILANEKARNSGPPTRHRRENIDIGYRKNDIVNDKSPKAELRGRAHIPR